MWMDSVYTVLSMRAHCRGRSAHLSCRVRLRTSELIRRSAKSSVDVVLALVQLGMQAVPMSTGSILDSILFAFKFRGLSSGWWRYSERWCCNET
jgi:hypothetical protein